MLTGLFINRNFLIFYHIFYDPKVFAHSFYLFLNIIDYLIDSEDNQKATEV